MAQGDAMPGRIRPQMRALRGQWNSAECTKKVSVMLSKALLAQDALAAVLELMLPQGGPVDRALQGGDQPNVEDIAISSQLLIAMRIKLDDSMVWSYLARDNINEMISHGKSGSRPFGGHDQTPRPGEETHENLIDASLDESQGLQRGGPHLIPASRPQRGETEQTKRSLLDFMLSHEEHVMDRDGQDFTGLASQGSEGARRIGSKRDRGEFSAEEEDLRVEYQEMRPGNAQEKIKGIPDDGHHYWKKYGSKQIQRYTNRRGYYKCSLSGKCKATKTVTPTNTNPSIYEVVYEHEHTCSATTVHSRRRRCWNPTTPATPQVLEVDISPCVQEHCPPNATSEAVMGVEDISHVSEGLCPRDSTLDQEVIDVEVSPASERHCPHDTTPEAVMGVDISHCVLDDAEAGSPDGALLMPGDDWGQMVNEICELINVDTCLPSSSEGFREELAPYDVSQGDYSAHVDADLEVSSDDTFSEHMLWLDDNVDADSILAFIDGL